MVNLIKPSIKPVNGLWLFVVLLLLYLGVRTHQIDTIPLFIDETINIERSIAIADGTYLQHARTGKFLLPYVSLLFQPHLNTVYPVRLSLILLTCLSIASAFAIARRYGELWGGVLTMVLITGSPMLFLYDRFALADTLLHVLIMLWIWLLLKVFDRKRPNWIIAVASGIIFVVAMLAKASAIFLVPLPIVFAMLLARWTIQQRIMILSIIYGVIITLWLPFMLVLWTQQINYFGKSDHIAPSADTLFDIDRITHNTSFYLDTIVTYHGAPLMLVAVIAVFISLRFRPRILLSLCAGVIGYGVAIIWLGGFGLFGRYYAPLMPILFIIIAIAWVTLANRVHPRAIWILVGGTIVWLFAVSAPFIIQVYNAPTTAPLYDGDANEYLFFNSTGFGIRELATSLETLAEDSAIIVEGVFVGCATLDLYTNHNPKVTVQCPNVLSGDRRANYLNDYLPEQIEQYEQYYLVFETEGVIAIDEITSVDFTLVDRFDRPGTGQIQLVEPE